MIQKIVTKKHNGNIISLVLGQMIILIFIIWALFNFRMTMLNAAFNYIDDVITTSLLGGAIINVPEYGKSNQIIIHNDDVYGAVYDGVNWSDIEEDIWLTDILLSELNYKSDIRLTKDNLEKKIELKNEYRTNTTPNISDDNLVINVGDDPGTKDWEFDYYIRKSISAFIGNLNYNFSNGWTSSINANQPLDDVYYNTLSNNGFNIKNNILQSSFISTYINGDIEVTRFDLYNVYRQNLAEKHIYMSEFFYVKDKDTLNSMYYPYGDNLVSEKLSREKVDYLNKGIKVTIEKPDGTIEEVDDFKESSISGKYSDNSDVSGTEYQFNKEYELIKDYLDGENNFDLVYKPIKEYKYKDASGNIVIAKNENYSEQREKWLLKKVAWDKDTSILDNKQPLICYTDAKVSYQGEYNSDRIKYEYFYNKDNKFEAEKINSEIKAPITLIQKYSFRKHFNQEIRKNYDNNIELDGKTQSDLRNDDDDSVIYYSDTIWDAGMLHSYNEIPLREEIDSLPLLSSKIKSLKNKEINNTTLYCELTFKVRTFPVMPIWDNTPGFSLGGDKAITIARLVDIEINPDGYDID